jgi:formiminotetrahydrofolate cyclodeaminase
MVMDDALPGLGRTTLSSFFHSVASTEPVPGGGCASAVCGYLGVALLLKSIRISLRGRPEGSSLEVVAGKLAGLGEQLLLAAQADSDSFGGYMKALKLPKSNPEEQRLRAQNLKTAAITAAEAALNILDLGNSVLDYAHQVQFSVLSIIKADERGCVELISAMNVVARENAAANMAGFSSDDPLRARLEAAVARHTQLLAACLSS